MKASLSLIELQSHTNPIESTEITSSNKVINIDGDNVMNIDTRSPGFQPTNVLLSKEIRENVAEINFYVNNIEENFLNDISLLNNSMISSNSVDNDNIINNNNDLSTCAKNKDKDTSLRKKLASWAIEENITQSSFKKLLEILRNENDLTSFHNLPKDPRTMLFTPSNLTSVKMSTDSFYYFGIAQSINILINQCGVFLPNCTFFELAINIDGLPISKSSSNCLWPILVQIKSIEVLKKYVLMVAL